MQEPTLAKVRELLRQGVIQRAQQPFIQHGFFLIPKPSPGEFREILNCQRYNERVVAPSFRMEGLHTLRELARPGDYAVGIGATAGPAKLGQTHGSVPHRIAATCGSARQKGVEKRLERGVRRPPAQPALRATGEVPCPPPLLLLLLLLRLRLRLPGWQWMPGWACMGHRAHTARPPFSLPGRSWFIGSAWSVLASYR